MSWINHTATVLLSGLLCALAARGALAVDNAPIEITADTAEYDEAAHTVTYTGNVAVVQDTTTIQCDRLTLHQPEAGPQIIIAEGDPVRFHQPAREGRQEVRGRSERAEYDLDQRRLTLVGNAELVQAGDRVTSDRIQYDIASAVVTAGAAASGKERVRTIIQPRK